MLALNAVQVGIDHKDGEVHVRIPETEVLGHSAPAFPNVVLHTSPAPHHCVRVKAVGKNSGDTPLAGA